jgi:murein L,D-transpeptidase YafK
MTLLVALWIALHTLWEAVAPRPLPPLRGPVDHILIDKSERTLSLVQDGRPVRTYPVGLGFAPEGDKVRQGDGRTPEGTFRIDLRNEASQYHLSLRIDYPRPEDLSRAAAEGYDPGGEIFIHGQPPGLGLRERLAGDWTAGCIAVTNANIQEIWRVTPVGTRVEIVP